MQTKTQNKMTKEEALEIFRHKIEASRKQFAEGHFYEIRQSREMLRERMKKELVCQ